ncbi:MAG TPA: hypothetical protein VKB75_05940, partial [Jatrophihabitans sp.]|nr:hypothetical protein [Jatrophihabitans sp.]
EIAAGARSAAEAHVLAQLRRSRLPDFELNVPVVDVNGKTLFVLDVLWRRYRAVLEIEGREYHFGAAEWQSTLRRHNALTAAKLALLHYPPSALMGRDNAWLGEIERWLRTRADELGVAYTSGRPDRPLSLSEPQPWLIHSASPRLTAS